MENNNGIFFAESLRVSLNGTEQERQDEETVSQMLDIILNSIRQQSSKEEDDLEEDEVNNGVEVNLQNVPPNITDEILSRLECLGFEVRMGYETEEEAEYNIKLWEDATAEGDTALLEVLNEAFITHEDFIISW